MHPLNIVIRRNRIGVLAATAILVAACSNAGSATTAPATAPATQTPPTTAPATEEPSEEAEAYEVELANSSMYGKFLTGEDGKSLYLFTPDTTSASSCNGDCAATWPPFVLEDGETVKGGEGVTGTFGTITRTDGSKQVAYAGHPLYYYAADTAAGDTKGQGLFDKWYLVKADGSPVSAAPAASGGKYGS